MTTKTPQRVTLADLRPHDLFRVVSNPLRFGRTWPSTNVETSDLEFDLLHRPRPKPPVGTILTGRDVKNRLWKRGTKFCLTKHSSLARDVPYSVRADLYSITTLDPSGHFVLDDGVPTKIGDDAEFVLVYRPEEESDRRKG